MTATLDSLESANNADDTNSGIQLVETSQQAEQNATSPLASGITSGHKVLVGIGFIILVSVVMTEIAGKNKNAADVIILLLIGVFMILGITHSNQFASWVSGNPWNPNA
jgi:hypothetical protein